MIDNYQADDSSSSFLFVADPMCPNGGILMRFKRISTIPLLSMPLYGAARTYSAVLNDGGTPGDPSDDTYVYPTVGIAQQYDGCGLRTIRPPNLLHRNRIQPKPMPSPLSASRRSKVSNQPPVMSMPRRFSRRMLHPTTPASVQATTKTQADEATPTTSKTPPVHQPRPKVRFAVHFNSYKRPIGSTDEQPTTQEQTATDESSEHKSRSSSGSHSERSEHKNAA